MYTYIYFNIIPFVVSLNNRARMRYCPYWPAQITSPPIGLRKPPKNKVCVLFFGSKQFGYVDHDKVEAYVENRSKFMKKGKGVAFQTAMQHMDDFISDPVKFRSHVYVEPTEQTLQTENDIEKSLGIKHEVLDIDCAVDAAGLQAVSWSQEKDSLIEKMAKLKSENQKIMLHLKKTQKELDSVNEAKQISEEMAKQKELQFSSELNSLQAELANANASLSELQKENRLLLAQTKQLENSLSQSNKKQPDVDNVKDEENNSYEVEKLIDDEAQRMIHGNVHHI